MRSARVLIAMALLLAACGGPSDDERAACATGDRMLRAAGAAATKDAYDDGLAAAKRSGNRKLIGPLERYGEAVGERQQGAAAAALGELTTACEDLGIPPVGFPEDR